MSVVTSTRNKAKYLELTLTGYSLQSHRQFEIIVVNDGSSDETEMVIEHYQKILPIRYIHQQQPLGISASRNCGLRIAEGEIVVFTDDDRIPCPTFLEAHSSILANKQNEVSIGNQHRIVSYFTPELDFNYGDAVGFYGKHPELLDVYEPQTLLTPRILADDFHAAVEACYLSRFDDAMLRTMADQFGDELVGFHLAWSKAFGGNMAFNRAGGADIRFDEQYTGYGKEDTDYAYQLYERGYRFRFNRNAHNYHQEHPRRAGEMWEHFRNFRYFCSKYSTLEVLLHKLDQEDVLTLHEANAILEAFRRYGSEILPKLALRVGFKEQGGM